MFTNILDENPFYIDVNSQVLIFISLDFIPQM